METIKRKNAEAGKFFFSDGAMRFFRSRVGQYGYMSTGGKKVYFVTSERFDHKSPRLYSVRVANMETGDIDEVSEFQEYRSRSGADKRAQSAANSTRDW
jgi:hypothetical protein